jgi:hypothetical protein
LPKPSFGWALNSDSLGSFNFGNFIFLKYPRSTPSFFFFFRFTFSTANFEMQQHIKIIINTAIVTPMISPIAACFLWDFIQPRNQVFGYYISNTKLWYGVWIILGIVSEVSHWLGRLGLETIASKSITRYCQKLIITVHM